MKKVILLPLLLLHMVAFTQSFKYDFSPFGTPDSLGFSFRSLCRLKLQMVRSPEEWPRATFNDDVCEVPASLREIRPGMVGLVVPYHGGDCHAKFDFTYSVDDSTRQIIYHVFDYYGGCRAGGYFHVRFTQVPAPPEGYEVVMRRHLIEYGIER